MEQQIRFCVTSDGIRIAYATYSAAQGHPLVVTGALIGQEEVWKRFRDWFERVGRGRRLVTIDSRGAGASQRDPEGVEVDDNARDIEAVVDHLGLQTFDLLANSFTACQTSMRYAAAHPERVSRLVLWSATASGPPLNESLDSIEPAWSLYTRAVGTMMYPSGPPYMQRWCSDMLRKSTTPAHTRRLLSTVGDMSSVAVSIGVPALVLHRRGGQITPLDEGRAVAALIPDSRFVALEGDSSDIHWDFEQYIDVLDEFLSDGASRTAAPSALPGTLVTILFTDLASSTALTQRLGDAKAQELVRAHNTIVRGALRSQGGSEIKHTGDGIMASFPSASGALESAIAIQRGVAGHDSDALAVKVGLNAGEPVAEESDLFGSAVQLARRVCDQASGGEILVSDVVRQLAAGKDFLFSDRGAADLKGFDEAVRLFVVRWQEPE